MFRIKICGVRRKDDIDAAARFGGDAIGLNFFPPSVRYVDPLLPATAKLSAHAGEAGLTRVGVFVNASEEEMTATFRDLGLDAIQLHGDETTALAGQLIDEGLQVIRAIKLSVDGLTVGMIADQCGPWIDLGCHLLLDADAGAAHGGSGKCLDWNVVGRWAESRATANWTLAGGLDASNVAEAIEQSGAHSVDTASGAEETRGTKSAAKIESFVKACRQAFS